jgi:hypothetical protein
MDSIGELVSNETKGILYEILDDGVRRISNLNNYFGISEEKLAEVCPYISNCKEDIQKKCKGKENYMERGCYTSKLKSNTLGGQLDVVLSQNA